MNPVQKALWYVESHSRNLASLDEIAAACHVSAFHITRAFAATAGVSLMRYVRGRRLTEAARQLASGAEDILGVALEAGYGSHEAFTRAFREHFTLTPEQLRARGHLDNLPLTHAITMNTAPALELAAPRFELLKPTELVGIVQNYNCQATGGIPEQWQRFQPYIGTLPHEVKGDAYGVSYGFDGDGNFNYLTGVEVRVRSLLPKELTSLPLPSQRYAVFRHSGHVAGVRATCDAIWNKWFPSSGYEPVEAPMLERYGPSFNPRTGLGGLEIWVPIKG
jgi:AraC family transcriptional regulator